MGSDFFFARDEAAADDLVCKNIRDTSTVTLVPEAVSKECDDRVEWGISYGGIVPKGARRGIKNMLSNRIW